MKYLSILFLLLLAKSASAQLLNIDERVIDFGERYQYDTLVRDVRVWNYTKQDLVLKARPSTMTSLTIDHEKLPPGESTLLHVTAPLEDRVGAITFRVGFDASSGDKVEHNEIVLRGYIDSVLNDPKPIVNFGVVSATGPVPEKIFEPFSSADPNLRITKVIEAPSSLNVRIEDNGRKLAIKPANFETLGYRKSQIKFALDATRQREASAVVFLDARGDVVPDRNPVDLGVQREGSVSKARLQLSSLSHAKFAVGKIDVDLAKIDVEEADCLPKKTDDCHAFILTINPQQPHGQIAGTLKIELPTTHQEMLVKLNGLFIAKDALIQSLNETNSQSGQSQAKLGTDLTKALQAVTNPETEVTPAGEGPLLKWKVANEAGIYGYAIFRSESEGGKFDRVNSQMVKAKNQGDDSEAAYQYRDNSAVAGKAYWYYITIFYNSGKKIQLTTPQRIVAK